MEEVDELREQFHLPLISWWVSGRRPPPLRDYFLEEPELRAQYSDQEIQKISTHLQRGKLVAWSGVPRLYIVLRRIGQLQSLDDIISHGISDYWFPFSAKSVQATTLSSTKQSEFLEAQKLVLTKAVDLEKNGEKKHFHFNRSDTIPFKGLGEIGRGGYATVDKVSSLFSRREYARKLFKRQNGGNKKAV
ncbi:hypothetical protein GJ744_006776 [Endocarpon pusillum]|uniref:Protein kinase domain-containing protein n=1 Tax=Endocarpon pusillum TaxID=364733 RepID=A0A8H7A6Q9_9EURO|nr:hypothetical protein GJ744_006776 [Endocarpon pusillum]